MLISIINKILVILYVLSFTNVIRHTYYFIQAWIKAGGEDSQKYKLNKTTLLLLGISISYIISSLFVGITL